MEIANEHTEQEEHAEGKCLSFSVIVPGLIFLLAVNKKRNYSRSNLPCVDVFLSQNLR